MCIFFLTGYAFAFGGHALGGALGAESEYVGGFSADGSYHERKFGFYFATAALSSAVVNASMGEKARTGALLCFTVLY